MFSHWKQFDVLVIGAGPAGIAAAVTAAEHGVRVGVVDDNPAPGGQIWRGERVNGDSPAASWLKKMDRTNVESLCGTRVVDQPGTNVLRAETSEGFVDLGYGKLILATGAREVFLPFPGWTLPNVTGAGALQALVKSGLPIQGRRIVVAGSGPLLLAVAAYLREHGAEIVMICEQASRRSLAWFGLGLLSQPQKVTQGFSLRKKLKGIAFVPGSWPVAAMGDGVLKEVFIARGKRIEKISCDYLACGFHLVPNVELPVLLGCRLREGYVAVDDLQRTSVADVFCAGEPTGIGGVELALTEGQIAGLAAAGREGQAREQIRLCTKQRHFARALDRTFATRPELKQLPLADTIVCRCEDVTHGRLKQFDSWKYAKLQTRCGMGPCQGRVCGPAAKFLFGWQLESIRPPVFPTFVSNLAAVCSEQAGQSEAMRGLQ